MKTGSLVGIENDSCTSSINSSPLNTPDLSARESMSGDVEIHRLSSSANFFHNIISFAGISSPEFPHTLESLNILQDMFPNHPRHVIEGVFRWSRNLDAAVDALLAEQSSAFISSDGHGSAVVSDPLQYDGGLRRRRSL